MSRNKTNLRTNQQRAITSLMTEPTIQKAARAAGVSKATMFRWLAEPEFSAALRETSGQLLEGAVATLQAGSGEAVEALRQIVADQSTHPQARVSAARAILEMALRSHEMFQVEERLAALEERLAAVDQMPRGLRRVK